MDHTTKQTLLAPETTGLSIQTDRFKTSLITISFVLPLDLDGTAAASLLARLLEHTTALYNTPVALQRKLLSLYGARFFTAVNKAADLQLLSATISVINDRYALHGEPLLAEAAAFLCDALFAPNLTDGDFSPEEVALCRRLLVESIEGLLNDKRRYAIARMYGAMCPEEPFGIPIGGTVEAVEKLTGQDAVACWRQMLQNAPAIVSVVGGADPQPVYDAVLARFSQFGRTPKPLSPRFVYRAPAGVKEVSETMALTQGKLVLGFRSTVSSLEQNNLAMHVFCDMFGGSPYSRLFTVVREQRSLCYYCAARLQSTKGFVCVDCGIENRNIEPAKEEILAQLAALQRGEFDESLLSASLLSLTDSARSVADSQLSLLAWYISRLFDAAQPSPEEWMAELRGVTAEAVVEAANALTLDTVFALKANEEQPAEKEGSPA